MKTQNIIILKIFFSILLIITLILGFSSKTEEIKIKDIEHLILKEVYLLKNTGFFSEKGSIQLNKISITESKIIEVNTSKGIIKYLFDIESDMNFGFYIKIKDTLSSKNKFNDSIIDFIEEVSMPLDKLVAYTLCCSKTETEKKGNNLIVKSFYSYKFLFISFILLLLIMIPAEEYKREESNSRGWAPWPQF